MFRLFFESKFGTQNICFQCVQTLEIHRNVSSLIRLLTEYQEKSRINQKQNNEIWKRLQSGDITELFLIFKYDYRFHRKFELLINIDQK